MSGIFGIREPHKARPLSTYTLASAIFLLFLFPVSLAIADTIIFNDLTENVSLTTSSSRETDVSCTTNSFFELCLLILNPPSATATLLSPPSATLGIAEAGSTNGSDEIAYGQVLGTQILGFNFFSDLDPGIPIITCSPPITSCLTETGELQTAFQLAWSDGTLDLIQFRSDVPEAAPWLLLLVGVVALSVAKRTGFSRFRDRARLGPAS